MKARGPEECCHLLVHVGVDRNAVLVTHNRVAYFDWLLSLPQRSDQARDILEAHSRMIRAALHRDGIPVLKDMLHMLFLDQWLEIFPNAVIVHLYRRPDETVLSACESYAILARAYWHQVDDALRREIGKRVMKLFASCMSAFCDAVQRRRLLGSKQLVIVPYTTLLTDPMAVVKRVCEARGLSMSLDFEEAVLKRAKQPHHGRYVVHSPS